MSPFRARRPNPVPIPFLEPCSPSQGVDRPNCITVNSNTDTMTNLSTKSPSLSGKPLIVDLNDLDVLSPCKPDEASRHTPTNTPPPTQKTLRRRKRIPIFRASSPAATSPIDSMRVPIPPRPLSQPFLRPTPHYLPLAFPMGTPSHSRPESPTPTLVRIGHPSRPYYSAIRKNMSRPASPTSTPSHGTTTTTTTASHSPTSSISSRPTSVLFTSAPSKHTQGFKLMQPSCFIDTPLDDDFDDDDSVESACLVYPIPRGSAGSGGSTAFSLGYGCIDRVGSPPSFGLSGQMRGVVGFGGCSVSGETELRMALATSGQKVDEVYRFKDMRDDHGLMSRVRRLRRGLRELMPKKT
ncbi:hypothetical protein BDN72DRAFT_214137 [Pluteus cervinus]|uniref:Uncharacterized protein n=1 Tax=Pluteus cervinus TaxID=181527 RepID=A0ACD3B619_9AGAR|nr:hypothetical protein BDN72DRAFT_214137 [Pluteus cervinus]